MLPTPRRPVIDNEAERPPPTGMTRLERLAQASGVELAAAEIERLLTWWPDASAADASGPRTRPKGAGPKHPPGLTRLPLWVAGACSRGPSARAFTRSGVSALVTGRIQEWSASQTGTQPTWLCLSKLGTRVVMRPSAVSS